MLPIPAPAVAQESDFVTSNRANYEPARQQALRQDPRYLALDTAVYNAGESDREVVDAVVALMRYVGENYVADSDLHIAQLLYTIDQLNILDYERRQDAFMRERLATTLPLAEAKLGADDERVRKIRETLGWNYSNAGEDEKAVALLGFDPSAGVPEVDPYIDQFYGAQNLARLELLEQQEGQLSGAKLIANLREQAQIHFDANGKFWSDYSELRARILNELTRLGLQEELGREALELIDQYSGDLGGPEMVLLATQHLAYQNELRGSEADAAAALGDALAHPDLDHRPEYYTIPPQDTPLQPLNRVPQAKAQLARLRLLQGAVPAEILAEALAAARYATAYLTAFRKRQEFDGQSEVELSEEFAAPDEPFGQDARQQYATLVEALWRNRAGGADLMSEAFLAAQNAMDEGTTQAIARTAALAVAERVGASGLVIEREELADRITELNLELDGLEFGDGRYGEVDRQLRLAVARQSDIDLALAASAPEYFQLIRPEPLTLDRARALLAPREAMMLILPTEFGTHVLVVTKEGDRWHRSPMTAAEIADSVALVRLDLDPWGSGARDWDGGFPADEAHALYLQLVEPARSSLAGHDTILYAAGGALGSLPLTVLVTEPPPEPGRFAPLGELRWLGDDFAFAQLPSLPSLAYLRRNATTGSRHDQPLAGFGDPALEGEAAQRGARSGAAIGKSRVALAGTDGALADIAGLRRLARLPGTASELAALRDALDAGPEAIMLGNAATETAVKRSDLSRIRFLAFATHGLLAGEGNIAGEPGLVFTPPSQASERDDGLLTASEILSLQLSAEWVMLSACNTAAGDGLGGSGLSGLARSFFYAGARSLLASHWPVSDAMAPILTGEAVRLLEENPGMSRAEAMRRSMKSARQSDLDLASHPANWAPFITVGDPR